MTVTSSAPIVRGYNESISVEFDVQNVDQYDILVAPTGTTNYQFRLVFSENDVTTTGDGSGSGFPREEFPLEGSGSGGGRRRRRDVFAGASFYFESVDLDTLTLRREKLGIGVQNMGYTVPNRGKYFTHKKFV